MKIYIKKNHIPAMFPSHIKGLRIARGEARRRARKPR